MRSDRVLGGAGWYWWNVGRRAGSVVWLRYGIERGDGRGAVGEGFQHGMDDFVLRDFGEGLEDLDGAIL